MNPFPIRAVYPSLAGWGFRILAGEPTLLYFGKNAANDDVFDPLEVA